MSLRWYVVQTNPKLEYFAKEQLLNQQFQVFIPVYKKKYFKRSVLYTIANLFPGYIFVAFDIEKDPWKCINGTRGVKKILSMDRERPSPINSFFIEDIMQKTGKDGFIETSNADDIIVKYTKGDQLKITEGSFKGHIGTYEFSDKKKIAILLSLLGQKSRVWIDPNQVVLQIP